LPHMGRQIKRGKHDCWLGKFCHMTGVYPHSRTGLILYNTFPCML
jgi:hypothetical protein